MSTPSLLREGKPYLPLNSHLQSHGDGDGSKARRTAEKAGDGGIAPRKGITVQLGGQQRQQRPAPRRPLELLLDEAAQGPGGKMGGSPVPDWVLTEMNKLYASEDVVKKDQWRYRVRGVPPRLFVTSGTAEKDIVNEAGGYRDGISFGVRMSGNSPSRGTGLGSGGREDRGLGEGGEDISCERSQYNQNENKTKGVPPQVEEGRLQDVCLRDWERVENESLHGQGKERGLETTVESSVSTSVSTQQLLSPSPTLLQSQPQQPKKTEMVEFEDGVRVRTYSGGGAVTGAVPGTDKLAIETSAAPARTITGMGGSRLSPKGLRLISDKETSTHSPGCKADSVFLPLTSHSSVDPLENGEEAMVSVSNVQVQASEMRQDVGLGLKHRGQAPGQRQLASEEQRPLSLEAKVAEAEEHLQVLQKMSQRQAAARKELAALHRALARVEDAKNNTREDDKIADRTRSSKGEITALTERCDTTPIGSNSIRGCLTTCTPQNEDKSEQARVETTTGSSVSCSGGHPRQGFGAATLQLEEPILGLGMGNRNGFIEAYDGILKIDHDDYSTKDYSDPIREGSAAELIHEDLLLRMGLLRARLEEEKEILQPRLEQLQKEVDELQQSKLGGAGAS
ncbi:unnamed protein product [Choristocarpus tenellus]